MSKNPRIKFNRACYFVCLLTGLIACTCRAANFSESGTTLNLNLSLSNDIVSVLSQGRSYVFTLAATTWSGTNSANVSGNGTSTLTVSSAGITAFTTGITLTDNGNPGGSSLIFANSGANFFSNNLNVILPHGTSVTFDVGANVRFTGPSALTAYATGTLLVNSSAFVSTDSGAISLSGSGNVSVSGGATVVSSSNTVTLAADVTSMGAGDDGSGTLTISAGANVNGTSVSLRGADVDNFGNIGAAVAPSNVATYATTTMLPFSIAFDSTGKLYVANSSNNKVASYTATNPATLIDANYITGQSNPTFIAIDKTDNLYISNQNNTNTNSISKYNSTGGVVNANYISNINTALGIAFDATGNLYVVSNFSKTVSEYSTANPTTGVFLSSFSTGSSNPNGIAIDSAGFIYISNTDGSIGKFSSSGAVINATFATGLTGAYSLSFDTSDNLYVGITASTGVFANSVVRVTPSGAVSKYVTGLSLPAGVNFYNGNLYAANASGTTVAKVTQAVPATTAVQIQSSVSTRQIQIGGTNNSAVAGISLTSAELAGISTTSTGSVTIGDNNQTGNISFTQAIPCTTAGAALFVQQLSGAAGTIVLDDSSGIALNGNGGNISITAGAGGITALAANNSTAEIATTGSAVTLNTTGPIGTSTNRIQFADNANSAQQNVIIGSTNQPSGIFLDGLGNLTLGNISENVANANVTVTARTNLTTVASNSINSGTGTLSLGADLKADGMADDGNGTLSIGAASNIQGRNIVLRGGDVDINVTANIGSATSSSPTISTFVNGAKGLNQPVGLAFDQSGVLYVSNLGNGTINTVTPSGTVGSFVSTLPSSNAGICFDTAGNLYAANYVSGVGGKISMVTPGGVVTPYASGVFNSPYGVAFDKNGNLFVSNQGNGTITKVAADASTSVFASGLSAPDLLAFNSNGILYAPNSNANTISKVSTTGVVSPFASGFNFPAGLAFDSAGNLFVTNAGNNTISEVTPAGAASSFISGLGAQPVGIAADALGNVYIANQSSNTISKLTPSIRATISVTILSSVPSRPIKVGGTDNAAVSGINLIANEMARVFTAANGSITIGDSTQTGNITFSNVTVANTAGASIVVLQSSTGAGGIILDDQSGTGASLNGNGGSVTLTAGTGGVSGLATNTTANPDVTGSKVAVTSAGDVGSSTLPIIFQSSNLSIDTSANNNNEFISSAPTTQLSVPNALNAGTGTITLASGSFSIAASANGNAIADTSPVVLKSASTTLDLGGNNETISSLSDGGVTPGMVTLGSGTLTTGDSSDTTFSGTIGGTGGLAKVGGGSFTLAGNNTYSGVTTVSAGSLLVNGTNSGTGAANVTGATLGGVGSIAGTVSVNTGGFINPGNGGATVGTLTVGALNFNGGTYAVDINGNTSDSIATNGTVNLNAAAQGIFNINSLTGSPTFGNVFTLIDNTGAGALLNPPLQNALEGVKFTFNGAILQSSYTGGNGKSFVLNVIAPNTAPTIAGAVANQPVNDNATIKPFSAVIIGDVDTPPQTLAISITLSDTAKGSLTTLNGFTSAGSGVYTFSGTATAATAAIQGVVFTPVNNKLPPGQTRP